MKKKEWLEVRVSPAAPLEIHLDVALKAAESEAGLFSFFFKTDKKNWSTGLLFCEK